MTRPIAHALVTMLVALSLLLGAGPTSANEGAFDPTFGSGGRLVVDISSYGQDNYAVRLIVRPDGKFLMGATCYSLDSSNNVQRSICLTQLLADGSYDGTFGPAGAGYVELDHLAASPKHPALADMTVLPDGRIVLLGVATDASNANVTDMVLAVLVANGSAFDTTVGAGTGFLPIQFSGLVSTPESLQLQPDGKLLVAGTALGVNGNYDFGVTRILANFSGLDSTFGSNGSQIVAFDLGGPAGNDADICYAVRLQSSGKIVLVGSANNSPADYMYQIGEIALVRLNSDGTRDLTFGSTGDGRVHYPTTVSSAHAYDAMIDASDRIVLAGSVGVTFQQWIIDRLSRDGGRDAAFNQGNPQIFNPSPGNNGVAVRVALTSDGIFVMGYSARVMATSPNYFGVTRLNSNGQFDKRFGSMGQSYGSFTATNDADAYGSDIAVTKNGLMVFGTQDQSASTTRNNKFGIGRLQYDQIFDNDFGLSTSAP